MAILLETKIRNMAVKANFSYFIHLFYMISIPVDQKKGRPGERTGPANKEEKNYREEFFDLV